MAFGNTVMIKLRPIRHEPERRARQAKAVVGIDDKGHGFEDLLHGQGGFLARCLVRPIDLGQQRRQYRRPRWRFHNLDDTARRQGHSLQSLAQINGDGMAGTRAVALGQ